MNRTTEINSQHLQTISDFLREETGISFEKDNWLGLKVAVRDRMRIHSTDDPITYFDRLKESLPERKEFISLVVVPETYFYRDRRQFETLQKHVIPEIITRKSTPLVTKPKIKIVSCGCSFGTEPYSIAMALSEVGLFNKADIEIIAIDINHKAIEFAKKAIFSKWFIREPKIDISKYFDFQGNSFILNENIKNKIKFFQGNLFNLADAGIDIKAADIVFFRNVLIYFNEEGILQSINNIAGNIDEKGYLFLGSAESLLRRDTPFALEELGDSFVWRRKAAVQRKDKLMLNTRRIPLALHGGDRVNKLPLPKVNRSTLKPRTVITKNIKKNESHYENALGYHLIRQFKKAEKAYNDQLHLTSNHIQSMIGLAKIYADSGKDQLAFSICQKALKLDSLLPDLYYIMGSIDYKNHNYESAVSNFKKTLYCDKDHFTAQYYLGLVYKESGRKQEAEKQFRITAHSIGTLDNVALKKEAGGHSGNYVFSMCLDSMD